MVCNLANAIKIAFTTRQPPISRLGNHQLSLRQNLYKVMATSTDTANAPADMEPVKEDFLRRLQREQTGRLPTDLSLPRPKTDNDPALQEQMNRLKDGTLQERDQADLVTQCQNTISRMSNDVKDASGYLPAYDQRTWSTVTLNPHSFLKTTLIEPSA